MIRRLGAHLINGLTNSFGFARQVEDERLGPLGLLFVVTGLLLVHTCSITLCVYQHRSGGLSSQQERRGDTNMPSKDCRSLRVSCHTDRPSFDAARQFKCRRTCFHMFKTKVGLWGRLSMNRLG